MPNSKPDFSALEDGKNILEVAFYHPKDHAALKKELGAYWFNQEIELPFLGKYYNKTIAVIDYRTKHDYRMPGDTTKQIFGIGATPEEAVKNTMESFVNSYGPVIDAFKKALGSL